MGATQQLPAYPVMTRARARELGLYTVDIHFNKQKQCWTIHFRGECIAAEHISFGQRIFGASRERPDLPSNPRYFFRYFVRDVVEIEPGHYKLVGMPARRGSRGRRKHGR